MKEGATLGKEDSMGLGATVGLGDGMILGMGEGIFVGNAVGLVFCRFDGMAIVDGANEGLLVGTLRVKH